MLGRGGALAGAGFFILLRGGLALLVGGVIGETTPHFPLYIVEALCVEAVALRGILALLVAPVLGETTPHFPLYIAEAICVELVALRWDERSPLTLGAVAGALIGSVGFFAEYAWSHVWMVNAWPPSLIGEGLPLALMAGVAAGVLGGGLGRAVTPAATNQRGPAFLLPVAGVALIAVFIWCVPMPLPPAPPNATVFLHNVSGGPKREALATVRLSPQDSARHARWLNITAWQGGGKVVDTLDKAGTDLYRSTEPIPLYGKWKSTLRLQTGRSVLGLPIYMPADQAIPVKEIPAPPQFTRTFEQDKKLLQREQKKGVSPVLTTLAYMFVLLIALAVAALLVIGLRKIRQSLADDESSPPSESRDRQPARGGAAAATT